MGLRPRGQDHPLPRALRVPLDRCETDQSDHGAGVAGGTARNRCLSRVVGHPLRLSPLVFVRPGELRAAQWAEFDFEQAEWRILAERMKMRVQHVVPPSTQAIAILQDLQQLTGRFALTFPGVRSRFRPMSENTITAALRRKGYSGQDMTGHGFRSMASALLNEQGRHRDAIERQLAHGERDAGGVQLCSASSRAARDDAGVGRLFGSQSIAPYLARPAMCIVTVPCLLRISIWTGLREITP